MGGIVGLFLAILLVWLLFVELVKTTVTDAGFIKAARIAALVIIIVLIANFIGGWLPMPQCVRL